MFQAKTVFITGGATGIGKGLAEAFHKRGSKVIIGGRRLEKLRALASAYPGMKYVAIDVADPASVEATAATIAQDHGGIDCLINNAGVQQQFDFSAGKTHAAKTLRTEIDTNFIGLILATDVFLPQLLRQKSSSVINISSGLGLVPISDSPIYCATKAAVHSFSASLRRQLRSTNVKVIEVLPPLVIDTELHDGNPPIPEVVMAHAQTVAQFIEETLSRLDAGEEEIGVGPVRFLHEQMRGPFEEGFARMNGG